VILIALALCIFGTVGFAVATTYPFACICHFFSGIGNAFCFLSCMMLISRWFPIQKQAFIIGLVVTVGMLGGVIAQSPFSYLAELLTWRRALLVDAAFGMLIYGLIYLFVFDSANEMNRQKTAPVKLLFWEGLKRSVFNLQNVSCGFYTCLMNFPLMVIGAVWGSLYLTQIHGVPLTRASLIVSMICMGTIVGSPIFGYFSDLTRLRRPWMAIGGVLSFVIMCLILGLPHLNEGMLTLLFFALGLFSSSQILGYPTITESNPKELTGTSMGIAAVIIMGLPMIAQPLSGYLLDLGWDGFMSNGTPIYSRANYMTAFSMFPVGFLIALISSYIIKEPKRLSIDYPAV
jgi:MFS family permease